MKRDGSNGNGNGVTDRIERFTSSNPCPVCGGHDGMTRGRGVRCYGFRSGEYVHCTRSDHAGRLAPDSANSYAHWLGGPCKCGVDHRDGASVPLRIHHGGGESRQLNGPTNGRRYFPTVTAYYQEMEKYLTRKHQVPVHLTRIDEYQDAAGKPKLAEARFEWGAGFKTYPTCHYTEFGWCTGDSEGKLPLWNLPSVIGAETVIVVEGPKCAKIVQELGFVATTNSHGGRAAKKTDWSPLAGKTVVIIPDHDETGEIHEASVRSFLAGLEPSPVVKVLRLPGLGDAEDIEQWRERLPQEWGPDEIRAELQRLIDGVEVAEERWATLGDIRKATSEITWHWPGWIPAGLTMAVTGFEGTGKTRAVLDWIRRARLMMEWPDGAPPTMDPNFKTLWICADGNHSELPAIATSFGIPDDAIVFPAPPENPFVGTDLDDIENQESLRRAIAATRPAFVVIDSITAATDEDICSATTVKPLKKLFTSWCQDFGCTVILISHLAKDGGLLGRRLLAISRTRIDLNCPDEEHSERLSMRVLKSFDAKPNALGVTMKGNGNEYDINPPQRVVGGKPTERTKRPVQANDVAKAKEVILEALGHMSSIIGNELLNTWAAADRRDQKEIRKAFFAAAQELADAGEIHKDGGPGTGFQVTLSRVEARPATTTVETAPWITNDSEMVF